MDMKKSVKWGAVGLLVVAAALTVVYRAVNRVPSAELPLNEQVYEIFTDGGCLSCHSEDPEVPFYAKLPVAGDVIKADIDSGYRAYDMTKFMEELKADEQVSAVDLAKVEKVVLGYGFHLSTSKNRTERRLPGQHHRTFRRVNI